MKRKTAAAPPQLSAARLARVDAARQAWIRKLVDLSRRNNLLYFRDLKVGTVDLSDAPPEVLLDLLQSGNKPGGVVRLAELVPAERRSQVSAAMTEIAARATANFEERGLDTLFLALGLASWTAPDGGRDASAPVLLVPLEVKDGGRSRLWTLRRAGDVKVNEVLLHALEEEHQVKVNGPELVAGVLGADDGDAFDLDPVFELLRRAARTIPGFAITKRWIVGNFAFQKMAIVNDLRLLGEPLARHDIVAGIAGDREAAEHARGDRTSADPRELDQRRPDDEFLVLDADSSQHMAIASALQERNGVISGPPGTGKSQTIANLIAEMIARGKKVLFVAEKRAALDVVLNRLSAIDLSHLCLDCHGAELTRRRVAEQLQASLDRVRDASLTEDLKLHQKFVERRNRLNAHVRALHQPRQPSGSSIYALYGRLLRHASRATASTRLPASVLEALTEQTVEECAQTLGQLSALAPLVVGTSSSPWASAELTTPDDVRAAIETVRRLARERWPALDGAVTLVLSECRLPRPETLGELRTLLDLLESVATTLSDNDECMYSADLERIANDLAPAASPLSALWARLTNSAFRRALREARAFHTGTPLSSRHALELVRRAQREVRAWQAAASDDTAKPSRTLPGPATNALTTAFGDLGLAATIVRRSGDLDNAALSELADWVRQLDTDRVTPFEVLSAYDLEQQLRKHHLGPLLDELRKAQMAPDVWPDILRGVWFRSCLEEAQLQEPSIVSFRGKSQDKVVEEFRSLDHDRLKYAVHRVRHAHARAALAARNAHPDQNTLVGREAAKRTRHLPLRRLFAEAPDVLLALRPCWMASPLSVSQLIPGDRPLFDLVVFDEASQVLPEDAVTSLLRGRRAVIAGDSRQLPPTTFFAAGNSDGPEEDDDSGTSGFQSILDVMSTFLDPAWSLEWHYRSRDEALIAFSNHWIYGDRLVTFPGPGQTQAVRHDLVEHVRGLGGQETTNSREVQRVVELVLEHAATRPNETLGVITMGIEHAKRIEMALAAERDSRPELDEFFSTENNERFFIKNLERVQGDERDAIILSIGYGKNEAGDLVYRFGPLLQDGGERRLNVAITRARQRMTVVSAFAHTDMRPDYPKLGVRLLRAFLEFAATQGRRLDPGRATALPLNDFEQAVAAELTSRGITVIPQLGTSSYRIDLVAMHPSKPGRYVLAIECDGATYHSAPTARDRDRLRQQQLENLGWRFHRIWSTDWFQRREDEVRRVMEAFEQAVAVANAQDSREQEQDTASTAPQSLLPELAPARTRTRRPRVVPGRSIDTYTDSELRTLVAWVMSDGTFRTDEEIIAELTKELGFSRRGGRIVAALTTAIHGVRKPH